MIFLGILAGAVIVIVLGGGYWLSKSFSTGDTENDGHE